MHNYFTTDQGIILVRLLLLHLINDFLIQPSSWVKHRNEYRHMSSRLYIHGTLAGIGAYIAIWEWSAFPIFIIVTITHISIDIWKSHQIKGNNLVLFLADQAAHVIILIVCWLIWISGFNTLTKLLTYVLTDYKIMMISMGYILCIFPLGYIVSFGTERWRKQIEIEGKTSLSDAGRWIGIIERILVFTLILIGRFETVGLVLTAKSILRFSDIEVRKNTEYVLIGTLISFALSILTGLLIKFLI
jgi:hypothetical protein